MRLPAVLSLGEVQRKHGLMLHLLRGLTDSHLCCRGRGTVAGRRRYSCGLTDLYSELPATLQNSQLVPLMMVVNPRHPPVLPWLAVTKGSSAESRLAGTAAERPIPGHG